MMQTSNLSTLIPFSADKTPVPKSSIQDVDMPYFSEFFEKEYGESLEEQNLTPTQLLENMNLMQVAQSSHTGV